jgi:WD40 repeat protein
VDTVCAVLVCTRGPKIAGAQAERDLAQLEVVQEPEHSHADVLRSRLDCIPDLQPLISDLTAHLPPGHVRISNRWPLPDAGQSQLRALTGHTATVSACAIAPDGTWLATTSSDATMRLWDMATGTCTATLTGHTATVNACAIAPDGTWLASASADSTLRLWEATTGRLVAAMRADGPLTDVAWLPDRAGIYVTGYAGVYLYTVTAPHESGQHQPPPTTPPPSDRDRASA